MSLPNLTGSVAIIRPVDRSRDPAPVLVVDHDPMFLNVVSTDGGLGSVIRNIKLVGANAYEVLAYVASAEGFIRVATHVAQTIQVALSNQSMTLVGSARDELEQTLRVLAMLIRATQAGLQREKADPAFEQLLREHQQQQQQQPRPQTVSGPRFTEQPFGNIDSGDGETVRIAIAVDHPDAEVRRKVVDLIFEKLGRPLDDDRFTDPDSWGKR